VKRSVVWTWLIRLEKSRPDSMGVLVPGWAMAARWGWRPAMRGSEVAVVSWKRTATTAMFSGSAVAGDC
jgi:hypothetical protein